MINHFFIASQYIKYIQMQSLACTANRISLRPLLQKFLKDDQYILYLYIIGYLNIHNVLIINGNTKDPISTSTPTHTTLTPTDTKLNVKPSDDKTI